MKLNYRKIFIRTVLVGLILAIFGLFFANRFIKTKGFDNLVDFYSNYRHNSSLAKEVEPEITVDVIAE